MYNIKSLSNWLLRNLASVQIIAHGWKACRLSLKIAEEASTTMSKALIRQVSPSVQSQITSLYNDDTSSQLNRRGSKDYDFQGVESRGSPVTGQT